MIRSTMYISLVVHFKAQIRLVWYQLSHTLRYNSIFKSQYFQDSPQNGKVYITLSRPIYRFDLMICSTMQIVLAVSFDARSKLVWCESSYTVQKNQYPKPNITIILPQVEKYTSLYLGQYTNWRILPMM